MNPTKFEGSSARLVAWLVDQGLPLWAAAGFDPGTGRFRERLTLGGAPDLDAPVRLTVQARQIYSYSMAARRGWHGPAANIARAAFAAMVRDYRHPNGRGGWVFSIGSDGSVVDGTRDLYAQAFVLLAAAAYMQASGERAALS